MPADVRRLADLGERRIYEEIIEPRYRSRPGFGDDCAPIGRTVVTTDTCPTPLLELLGEKDMYNTGWLLATINLSDLAAAGARPVGLVVNYTLPPSTTVDELDRLMQGVDDCAQEHRTQVIGGDIRDGAQRHLSATAIGHVRSKSARLSRRGAQAGDRLLLVGHPGHLWGAALVHGGYATDLSAEDRDEVFHRARRPMAQVRAGQLLARSGLATAAIDVSDGLYAAVRILTSVNGLGADMRSDIELEPLPDRICKLARVSTFRLGQTWGDWSLLVAARSAEVEHELAEAGISVREVGRLTAEPGRLRIDSHPEPHRWDGIEQERFSATSWHGDVEAEIGRMRSPAPGGTLQP